MTRLKVVTSDCVDDLVAVTSERTADGFRTSMTDTKFDNQPTVGLGTVSHHVKIQQMSIAILNSVSDARRAVIILRTRQHKSGTVADKRKQTSESDLG